MVGLLVVGRPWRCFFRPAARGLLSYRGKYDRLERGSVSRAVFFAKVARFSLPHSQKIRKYIEKYLLCDFSLIYLKLLNLPWEHLKK